MLRFVSQGLPIENVNSSNPSLGARANPDIARGFDIYFMNAERRYRIEQFIEGALVKTLYMHESRIETAEKW